MRLAIELLLSVLRSNKGGYIAVEHDPTSSQAWSVVLVTPQSKTPLIMRGDLPYQAAARCYDAWSKTQ